MSEKKRLKIPGYKTSNSAEAIRSRAFSKEAENEYTNSVKKTLMSSVPSAPIKRTDSAPRAGCHSAAYPKSGSTRLKGINKTSGYVHILRDTIACISHTAPITDPKITKWNARKCACGAAYTNIRIVGTPKKKINSLFISALIPNPQRYACAGDTHPGRAACLLPESQATGYR